MRGSTSRPFPSLPSAQAATCRTAAASSCNAFKSPSTARRFPTSPSASAAASRTSGSSFRKRMTKSDITLSAHAICLQSGSISSSARTTSWRSERISALSFKASIKRVIAWPASSLCLQSGSIFPSAYTTICRTDASLSISASSNGPSPDRSPILARAAAATHLVLRSLLFNAADSGPIARTSPISPKASITSNRRFASPPTCRNSSNGLTARESPICANASTAASLTMTS